VEFIEMRFRFIDRILEIEPGRRILAEKTLLAEEHYLRDHFPNFPVMPGVLMLEAMFQASMWLVRKSEDFQHAIVLLKEARNIKYADFVQPGQTLRISAEIFKQDERTITLKTEGRVNNVTAVNGRLVLERYNRAESNAALEASDGLARIRMRQEFERLLPAAA
jgi:3-hydroxyacyl-[acyl-carrier-protein] dehydratase